MRVDFVRDTLFTTTGDGGFDYGFSDTIYFDPPPHDSLYFADNLEFLRFYWREMSAGAVDMEWDVYPAGDTAGFRLPKQIWQYNWNSGDEQLNRGLAELFRDAVTAADTLSDIVWSDYDLVIIFHAGAGAEFNTGFDTTPHDIPSAWMVKDDFQRYLGMPNGIPVDGGPNYITGGLILPETESQEGIQISSLGVICSLFGHWLGAPALYDKDDGKPVVGKWSLMDRGFGNFYGAIPGELDAWSRSYMGWLAPVTATADTLTIRSRVADAPGVPQTVKIPITDREYFLLECRDRDPENDSVAIAYDREGRQMVFHDDYSVTYDPGFRVPVQVDNLDFDSPGSGILIWHVDEALDQLISEGRFNSVDERRGLDLEEADGAQDIGQDYPFLTPGWGTDYGVFEDAWYGDNDAHKAANQGNAVTFGDETFPNSRANSGAFTHIELTRFSRRAAVMGFIATQENLRIRLRFPVTRNSAHIIVGEFDLEPTSQEIARITQVGCDFIDGSGAVMEHLDFDTSQYTVIVNGPIARDLNGDGQDEIIWANGLTGRRGSLNALISQPNGSYNYLLFDSLVCDANSNMAFGGFGISSYLVITSGYGARSNGRFYDADLNLASERDFQEFVISLHRYGSADSDSFIVVLLDGSFYLWTVSELRQLGSIDSSSFMGTIIETYVADFDASGMQDIAYFKYEYQNDSLIIVRDPVIFGDTRMEWIESYNGMELEPTGIKVADMNQDGRYEFIGFGDRREGLIALTTNGRIADCFPWQVNSGYGVSGFYPDLLADVDGNKQVDILVPSFNQLEIDRGSSIHYWRLEGLTSSGKNLAGFPLATGYLTSRDWRLGRLDDDLGLELVTEINGVLTVYSLPHLAGQTPSIWWGQPYRDNDHSNAVWEPATPFSPSPDASLMPVDLCYNWPNPAQGSTAFRFFLNNPAAITVDIFDIAGERVTTLYGSGAAGQHSEIVWSLAGVPRGAYFANVKAVGAGTTETKLVKVAVK